MKFLRRLFEKANSEEEPEQLVQVYIPPLIDSLKQAEDQKGAPLEEEEVLSFSDNSICMNMSTSRAKQFAEERGYPDLSYETAWEEWQELRSSTK